MLTDLYKSPKKETEKCAPTSVNGTKKGSVLAQARNAAKASAAHILQTSTGTSNPVSHSPDNLPIHNSLDRADDSTDLNDIINNFVALEEEGLAPEYDERVEDELEVDKNIGESALQAFGLFLQRAQAEATAREHIRKSTSGSSGFKVHSGLGGFKAYT
ncbi:hypothetical protein BDP27DRAFT_1426566 [Rhodocollybia butyracea]|uniref:Uncharacterized protein n=1 Tax=Rhodocollybia butyracea TaxID=206335 RepID=A0A9P5PDP3_9AGAR|nr:hypothetical protein BDP27DRAFT_1426566 [Rhodocollybia butyracea]